MEIRKAKSSDVKGVTKVHVESWKTTYKDIFPKEFLESISYEKRHKLWETILNNSGEEIVYVIEVNNNIIGFLSAGPAREKNSNYDIEIYALYLLEEYQNKGYGQKLINNFFNFLKENDYNSVYVWVLKENSATEFYKKMGATEIKEKEIEIEKNKYKEIAFGWDHL
ncbi:MAG TPA: GNAT family N-acetyltransferase [Halanaerobiales bacterium]|nr:GNAT family N-acetyltransferase [Halanaerobiales bacterium]